MFLCHNLNFPKKKNGHGFSMSIFYFGQKTFEKTSNCLGNICVLLQGVGDLNKRFIFRVGSLWYKKCTEKKALMFLKNRGSKSEKGHK